MRAFFLLAAQLFLTISSITAFWPIPTPHPPYQNPNICAPLNDGYAFPPQDCQNGMIKNGVTEEEKQSIVRKHNDARILVATGKVPGQPKGVNLRRMFWDEQLAQQAQNLANTCQCRPTKAYDPRFGYLGQNINRHLAWHSEGPNAVDDNPEWSIIIEEWFVGYFNFTYPFLDQNGSGSQYTQLVWAETTYVGCGFSDYLTNDQRKGKVYVCYYGPAGNKVFKAPYETGAYGCENLC